jgi:hypothetical protein
MAGTRSAPAVNGTPSFKRVRIAYLDFSGDARSVSWQIDATATDAEIEAVVAQSQLVTYASIYEVEVSDVYWSLGLQGNADSTPDAQTASVHDNIVLMFQNAVRSVQRFFQPAPINTLFEPASDRPDITALTDLYVAVDTTLKGTYTLASARYTERREMNEKVRGG